MTAQNIRELITLIAENHLVERRTVNIPKNNEYANSVKESSKIFDDLLDNNYKSKCSVHCFMLLNYEQFNIYFT